MAHVHRPDGTFAGKLIKSRSDILHQASLSKTTLGTSELVAGFAEAMCALLVRYKDGFKETEGTKFSNHWATPDSYMRALQEGLSLKVERFAPALNHSVYLDAYFSRYEEDGSFGANVDAFSCRWTGPSQCNPEYATRSMSLMVWMAVRWALASATESKEPSFVLPHWNMDACCHHMSNSLVHLLPRVPKRQFKFKRPDFWKAYTGKHASHPIGQLASWDVDIIIVSNEAGLRLLNSAVSVMLVVY